MLFDKLKNILFVKKKQFGNIMKKKKTKSDALFLFNNFYIHIKDLISIYINLKIFMKVTILTN